MQNIAVNMPTQEEYSNLGSYLQSFSEITQITAHFYSLTGVLVCDEMVYSDERDIQKHLDVNQAKKYTLFPICINGKLWGFTVCSSNTVPEDRIRMSKQYLENIFSQVFENNPESMLTMVLEPLDNNQFNQMNYLSILLKMNPNFEDNSVVQQGESQTSTFDSSESYKSLSNAVDYILRNVTQPISLNEVADQVFLSSSYLSRLFKQQLHITFIDYVNRLKIAKAKELLALTNKPVNIISNLVGFSQTSYFTKTFKKLANTTPSAYRKQTISAKRIFTIPHTVDWTPQCTVFSVSKRFFKQEGIDFFYQSVNDHIYINSIDNLIDSNRNCGWTFTVDGEQPNVPADKMMVSDASEIQWVYTNFNS
ncbi:helix-turn-helix domain-containing protein [Lentilactobacillus sp. Marseille-Q4993]|uniref:helix-turn-helix domain-containing protein n=1 Tax=Lentilactobacillus sp. Marseille-Q4993 TaxID=3039492 RepID=UPI0024BD1F0B|nr:helix-turn-helix domain-containing protein [Lentilactobacillus sp. Marseille-Q4993]